MGSHATLQPMTAAGSAHVVVLGNEKGGSGKTTTAINLIVALLKAGHRVASIDTDSRQLSLTRYIENRTRWSRQRNLPLDIPTHFAVKLAEGEVRSEVEAHEFQALAEIIDRLGTRFDFVVIDTPGNDSYRMRLSHAMADTLVTPVNDSFVDLDVLGRIEGERLDLGTVSQYAELVEEARRRRAMIDGGSTDWVVVRNRISTIASRNQKKVVVGLRALSARLGFRIADGISERVIFREFFPVGLTAFDALDPAVLGVKPTMSHLAARREIRDLLDVLRLPLARPLAPSMAPGVFPEAVAATFGHTPISNEPSPAFWQGNRI